MCGNTYIKHRSLHKYTRAAIVQGGVKIKSMIYLTLLKRDTVRYVHDIRAVRGMRRGLSDHHVVLCKVSLVGAWTVRRVVAAGLGGLEARN